MKNKTCSATNGFLVVGVVLALALSVASLVLTLKQCDNMCADDVSSNVETRLMQGVIDGTRR